MKIAHLNELTILAVSHNPEIKKKVMLNFGDLPNLTNFAQAIFTPGQTSSKHCHQDMSEVFFVESGEGIMFINQQKLLLNRGTCVAVEAGEYHEITNTGQTNLVLTYLGIKL